jgi:hypothetical protein
MKYRNVALNITIRISFWYNSSQTISKNKFENFRNDEVIKILQKYKV